MDREFLPKPSMNMLDQRNDMDHVTRGNWSVSIVGLRIVVLPIYHVTRCNVYGVLSWTSAGHKTQSRVDGNAARHSRSPRNGILFRVMGRQSVLQRAVLPLLNKYQLT